MRMSSRFGPISTERYASASTGRLWPPIQIAAARRRSASPQDEDECKSAGSEQLAVLAETPEPFLAGALETVKVVFPISENNMLWGWVRKTSSS